MRFFYAKKEEQTCRNCKTSIFRGDEAVVIRWHSPRGTNPFIPLVFHVACYIEWVTNSFNRRWNDWKLGAEPRRVRKKRGRKFKYLSREQAVDINRSRSLINYHRKQGNVTRVEELSIKLKELESAYL